MKPTGKDLAAAIEGIRTMCVALGISPSDLMDERPAMPAGVASKWTPIEGQDFWYVTASKKIEAEDFWHNRETIVAMAKAGICFRTEEAATQARDAADALPVLVADMVVKGQIDASRVEEVLALLYALKGGDDHHPA